MRADKVTTTVRPVGWLRKGCGVLVWSAIGGAIGGGGGAAIDSALEPSQVQVTAEVKDTVNLSPQEPQAQSWRTQPWWKWGLGVGSSALLTGIGIYHAKSRRAKEVKADIEAMKKASTDYNELVEKWKNQITEIRDSLNASKTTLEEKLGGQGTSGQGTSQEISLGEAHEIYDNVHAAYRKFEEALADTEGCTDDFKTLHDQLEKLKDAINSCIRKNKNEASPEIKGKLLNLCSLEDDTVMTKLYNKLQKKLEHAKKVNELYKNYVALEAQHYNINIRN